MNKTTKYVIFGICIFSALIMGIVAKSIVGPSFIIIGALSMIPAISNIIRLFWDKWDSRFFRIFFSCGLVFLGFITPILEPSIYAYEKRDYEERLNDVLRDIETEPEPEKKSPDEAMAAAGNAMWKYAKKEADKANLRLPIEVETERVYRRVMFYDEQSIIVRYPFTYGRNNTIIHSYLFKINYNGGIIEILDYH